MKLLLWPRYRHDRKVCDRELINKTIKKCGRRDPNAITSLRVCCSGDRVTFQLRRHYVANRVELSRDPPSSPSFRRLVSNHGGGGLSYLRSCGPEVIAAILREVRPSSSVLAMRICLISFGAVTNSQTPLSYNFFSVLEA